MISRYSANDADRDDSCCNDATQDVQNKVGEKTGEETKEKKVTLEEMKVMLWEGFQWDEEDSTVDWGGILNNMQNDEQQSSKQPPSSQTHSDEVILHQAMDYLHLQPHDELISKLWAMKLVYCPCFLEEALKKEDFIGSMGEKEGSEMYIKSIPEWTGLINGRERRWRFLVCMFICRMLVYQEDGKAGDEKYNDDMNVNQIRANNYQRRLETYDIRNQLSYLCSGITENTALLVREMVDCGLLKREIDGSAYWQTSLDSQVIVLWEFLD
mmetsp:Transcript_8886/g.14508  ORF Transcript_8886/g.14508 Transcript_8886/m.14508 type:complete len:269 (-) Transcript_8886:53-859(-)